VEGAIGPCAALAARRRGPAATDDRKLAARANPSSGGGGGARVESSRVSGAGSRWRVQVAGGGVAGRVHTS
jgi:hypothetical protein